jgi:hypothetical protein
MKPIMVVRREITVTKYSGTVRRRDMSPETKV